MSLSHPTPYLEFSPKPRVVLKFPLPPASSLVQPFCPPQEILHSGTISSKFPVKLKTVYLTEKKMMLQRENCQASVSREPLDLCHQDGALRCQMQASGAPPLAGLWATKADAQGHAQREETPRLPLHLSVSSEPTSVLSDPAALFPRLTSQTETLTSCPSSGPASLEAEPRGCGLGDLEAPPCPVPVRGSLKAGQVESTEPVPLSRPWVGSNHVVIPRPILFRTTPQLLMFPGVSTCWSMILLEITF